ncbi:Helix-turn-helix domain protein [Flavobacterium sp. ACN2]|jgi:AraC-like DNA-binding protein|uniref:helix-turn-helix domain-containing protein n=1 Tax=Flavobacterium sp. ACN2 TaxID=1975676 RepID=UPI000BB349E3|nr:AraC family transcriptional regulator [Flavobacterium sp. ACN2]PBI83136.1 Helix-turn-helix domain protein [Flavobacterium sp. ACN2]
MRKFTHSYTLTPEWQYDLVKQLGTELLDNKLIIVPKDIGKGFFYFSQVTEGISVVYADLTATVPIKLTRQKSENEIFIFHFDLSEHINLIKINNIDYEIGSFNQLDLAILDNEIESTFKPSVNERTIALRLLINKKLLHDFIQEFEKKESYFVKSKTNKKTFYHYGNIDSNSILLIQSIKQKSVRDLAFDSFIKGVSLKVLGNFFNKFYETKNKNVPLTEIESEAIEKTKNYLLNNLYGPFPSLTFLASMAGMSSSKYKSLFKTRYNNTPKNLFIEEKINLAQKLLRSGEYTTLTAVMYELNYTKLSYFCTKYFEQLKRKPTDDFVKNHQASIRNES